MYSTCKKQAVSSSRARTRLLGNGLVHTCLEVGRHECKVDNLGRDEDACGRGSGIRQLG